MGEVGRPPAKPRQEQGRTSVRVEVRWEFNAEDKRLAHQKGLIVGIFRRFRPWYMFPMMVSLEVGRDICAFGLFAIDDFWWKQLLPLSLSRLLRGAAAFQPSARSRPAVDSKVP